MIIRLLIPLLLAVLAGCATTRDTPHVAALSDNQAHERKIVELAAAISALGERVDPDEARRAAEVAVRYPLELAGQYELTTPPLWHNTLVNLGVKPRGLCVHWTRDLLAKLRGLRLITLKTHWAVANAEATFRIEHSTAIITMRGKPMNTGIVLDPWRNSGNLFWSLASEDPEYEWHPLAEVQERRRERRANAEDFRTANR